MDSNQKTDNLVFQRMGNGDGKGTARSGVIVNTNPVSQHIQHSNQANGIFPTVQTNFNPQLLLSPQHFLGPGGDQNIAGGALLRNGGLNPLLTNLDISSSQFNDVINFDDAGVGIRGISDGAESFDGQDSELAEQSLSSAPDADLIEQRQAMEQAKMMAHFKQLRDMQQQQQLELMRQQQERIELMRHEQEKVQRMLHNARQAQWGSTAPKPTQNLPPHPPSPRRQKNPAPKLSTPKKPGRPVPNLPSVPSTPSEYRVNGNPDLESETASVYADNKLAQLQDGFAPLLNSDIECIKEESFVMRTGNLNFGDDETASQPDLASLHELTSSAWKNKQPKQINGQQNGSMPTANNQNTMQHSALLALNAQPPPGYINLLHLPNMLQGLPPNILEQLLHLQQQGQSVVIDANGHLAVHDMTQGQVLPAGGVLNGLGFSEPPPMQNSAPEYNSKPQAQSRNEPNSGYVQNVGNVQMLHQAQNVGAAQNYEQMQNAHQNIGQYDSRKVPNLRNGAQSSADNHSGAHELVNPIGNTIASNTAHPQHLNAQNRNVSKNPSFAQSNSEQLVSHPSQMRTQHSNGVLDFRESDAHHFNEDKFNFRGTNNNFKDTSQAVDNHGTSDAESEVEENEDIYEGEENEMDEENHEDEETISNEKPEAFDEQPIGGLGVKKTFEQLLEEELRKEQELGAAPVQEEPKPAARKHFLKKGEGVARFGIGGKPPPSRPKKVVPPKKKTSAPPSSARDVKSNKVGESSADAKQNIPRKTSSAANKLRPGEKLQLKPGKKKPAPNAGNSTKKPASATSEEASKSRNSRQDLNPTKEPKNKPKGDVRSEDVSDKRSEVGSYVSSGSDCIGEISFQKRMTEIAHNEKVEEGELEEFEILEQYADDNASFLSNVSAVNRVLQQKEMRGKPVKRATQPKTVHEVESEGEDVTLADEINSDEDNNLDNTLQDNQNSLPDDAQLKPSQNITGKSSQNSHRSHEHETKRLGNLDVSLTSSVGNTSLIATLQSLKTMQRKVATLDDRSKHHYSTDDSEDDEKTSDYDEKQFSDKNRYYNENDDEGRQFHDAQDQNKASPLKRISSGNEEYRSLNNNFDQKLGQFLSEEEKEQEEEKDSDTDFGDEEAWDDDSRAEDDWDKVFLKAKSRDKSKVSKSSSDTKSKETSEEDGSSTPPTSKLVAKLFPKLKPQKPKLTPAQEEKLEQPQKAEIGDGVRAKLLRDKLAELEREIERFRQENATLEKLRKEREEGLSHLKKEMGGFEKQKSEELKRIQDFKSEEMKKLKKEKKVFEEYQKNMRDKPNKKEREEIEQLKQQVEDLQDEMKRKEQRWTSSTARLRDRVESLEQENSELKEEIKLLEKRRLEAWQQRDVNGAAASSAAPASKPPRDSLGSTHYASNTNTNHHHHTSHPLPTNQLKKSNSGPQLSSRVKQPKPHKHSRRSLSRDHNLRLSNDNLRRSVQSLDSYTDATEGESIRPEDSASNIASSKDLRMGIPEPRQSASLAASQESSMDKELNSAPSGHSGSMGAAMGKKTSRKKAATLSVSSAVEKGDGQFEEIQHPDGKVERVYNNGAREILFSNGTRKQVSADGQSIIVSFFNGDIKQILPDQRVVYYYSEAQTTHTTYPDGLEILQFPNNQVEKHYPDGTKEITFPDQTIKYLFPNGIEENLFPNGTVIRVEQNGDKTMQFANGQREVHTAQYKRREYPDGTVKTVFPDGRQETRYSSGRIRVKDKDGHVIMDKRV